MTSQMKIVMVADVDNPNIGDTYLDSNGNFVTLTEENDLAELVAQRLFIRFQFFRGEWFFDLSEGTPVWQLILRKGFDLTKIRTMISQLILTTPGVKSITSLRLSVDARNRTLDVNFECVLRNGEVFNTESIGTFVLGL